MNLKIGDLVISKIDKKYQFHFGYNIVRDVPVRYNLPMFSIIIFMFDGTYDNICCLVDSKLIRISHHILEKIND
jgi:hypothetical protein